MDRYDRQVLAAGSSGGKLVRLLPSVWGAGVNEVKGGNSLA
jgi:hypothetical protein